MNERTSDGGKSSESAVVRSVERSHRVVEALQEMNEATVTEIANETGLSKGGAYKHLNTLREGEFVVKEDNVYRLGFRYLDLGGHLRSRFTGASLIKPKIQELAEKTNEVCLFTVEETGRAVTLFRENGTRGVFTRTRVGTRLYLHQTAGGKAILSQLPRGEVESIVDSVGLPEATENTITESDGLFEELERIRDRGYAYNRSESTEGLVAVAAPLVPNERVLGACAVAGPRHRMTDSQLEETIPEMLLSVVNELELNIAHSQ